MLNEGLKGAGYYRFKEGLGRGGVVGVSGERWHHSLFFEHVTLEAGRPIPESVGLLHEVSQIWLTWWAVVAFLLFLIFCDFFSISTLSFLKLYMNLSLSIF